MPPTGRIFHIASMCFWMTLCTIYCLYQERSYIGYEKQAYRNENAVCFNRDNKTPQADYCPLNSRVSHLLVKSVSLLQVTRHFPVKRVYVRSSFFSICLTSLYARTSSEVAVLLIMVLNYWKINFCLTNQHLTYYVPLAKTPKHFKWFKH